MKTKIMTILVLSLLIIIIGCGKKKFTCTYNNKNGYKYNSLLVVEHDNDKINSAKITMTYENSSVVSSMCEIFKSTNEKDVIIECNDDKITIDNYHLSLQNKVTNVTELKKYLIDNGYKCK